MGMKADFDLFSGRVIPHGHFCGELLLENHSVCKTTLAVVRGSSAF